MRNLEPGLSSQNSCPVKYILAFGLINNCPCRKRGFEKIRQASPNRIVDRGFMLCAVPQYSTWLEPTRNHEASINEKRTKRDAVIFI